MQLDPNVLPGLTEIRRRTQSLAMLDAIVSPEWEFRYYSFDAHWGAGEEMASMRNGCGDDWFLLMDRAGAALKGLAHESELAGDATLAAEVQRQVPPAFASFLGEPAFGMEWLSFCYWRAADDAAWHKVVHPDPRLATADDESAYFLALLVEPPSSYQEFASEYFEVDLPLAAIEAVYAHTPLTPGLVRSLNEELPMSQAREFASEIGYPVAADQ
jgi:hypothetical protein